MNYIQRTPAIVAMLLISSCVFSDSKSTFGNELPVNPIDDRPNIVLVMCDDLGYSDVGFNGAKDIKTPNIDELARGGVICSSGYVAHPFCGPSRMALVTGRYPHTFGAPFNLAPYGKGIEEYNSLGIDVNETLISRVLQDSGYRTGIVGKWHMGFNEEFHPNNRGFDEFYGFLGGGHKYFPAKFEPAYERIKERGVKHINEYLVPMQRNGEYVKEEAEYLTDGLSREAANFVTSSTKTKKPFFLFVSYNAPHSPLEATEEDLKIYAHIKDEKRRIYAAMVHAVDRGVGKLTKSLKDSGVYENTLIVFLSDNGGKLSLGATNRPLKEGKGSAYEGGYRVPMFFHWPAKLKAGSHFQHGITALDFYPTFAKLAKADLPFDKKLDGVDVLANLKDGSMPQRERMIYAVRHRVSFSDVGARKNQWKILRIGKGPWRLYNVNDDLAESNDVSKQFPDVVESMVSEAAEWSKSHTQPKWFHAIQARDEWSKNSMPRYDETFQLKKQK